MSVCKLVTELLERVMITRVINIFMREISWAMNIINSTSQRDIYKGLT